MKFLALFILFFEYIHADIAYDFMQELKEENYQKACRIGKKIISSPSADEKLISMVAQSCLKCDYIKALSHAQHRLRASKESRADAVAFSSVVLQKKLIYQFMYDNTDISTMYLPIVDHPLSHTFVAIRDGKYHRESENPKIITFKKDDKHYKVFIDKADKGRVVIEITDSKNYVERRKYL